MLALGWIGFLAARPVHIPVLTPPQQIEAGKALSLTGVRGQTFVVPTDGLDRIDLTLDAQVPLGERVRVKFELARGVEPRATLASSIAVFDRSGEGWPVQLTFDPHLTSRGESLYLRLESILSSPRAAVSYHYSRVDIYPHGQFLDLDQLTTTGQDLLIAAFRAPHFPKPLAWGEALIARARLAAQYAALAPAWSVVIVGALVLVATLLVVAAAIRLVVHLAGWRSTPFTRTMLAAMIVAIALAIVAGGEIPVGKLALELS